MTARDIRDITYTCSAGTLSFGGDALLVSWHDAWQAIEALRLAIAEHDPEDARYLDDAPAFYDRLAREARALAGLAEAYARHGKAGHGVEASSGRG